MNPSVLEGVQAVVNVGGLSNDPTAEYNPQANVEMNTAATLALGELARVAGVTRYVFASSASIYDVGVSDHHRDIVLTRRPEAPRAALELKYEAERGLLAMELGLLPVILRKGTVSAGLRACDTIWVATFVKMRFPGNDRAPAEMASLTSRCCEPTWRPSSARRGGARTDLQYITVSVFRAGDPRAQSAAEVGRARRRAPGLWIQAYGHTGSAAAERVLSIKPQIGTRGES
jgi:hypothetical protein